MIGNSARLACVGALAIGALVCLASPAMAVRKFCTDIHYNYSDHISGQDYLLEGNVSRAANHWMVVLVDGVAIYADYADSDGCSLPLATPAGIIETRTYPAIEIGSSYIWTFKSTVGAWTYTWNDLGHWEASPTPNVIFTHTSNVGFGHGSESIWNVSATLGRLATPEPGYDFGLEPGTYNILAEEACPFGISCYWNDVVYLGFDADLWGWDHHDRTIIGHEFGHYLQDRLFGSPNGQSAYCHDVPNTVNNLCRCDHVDSPATPLVCGGVPVNRAHCLQSRENFTAALGEGWAHFVAATLVNDPAGSGDRFSYYKDFKRTDLMEVHPPVSHNPAVLFRWMNNQCSNQLAGLGTELDWMGFLYHMRSKADDRYSFLDYEVIFRSSHVCNGTCNSSDTVTFDKLSQAVQANFGPAKAAEFLHASDSYGVNH